MQWVEILHGVPNKGSVPFTKQGSNLWQHSPHTLVKIENMGTEPVSSMRPRGIRCVLARRRMETSAENSVRCAQKSVILADEVSHICERSEGVWGRRSNVVALSLGRGLLSSASGFVSVRHNWEK